MKTSEKLLNIKPELEKIKKIALEELGVDIMLVFESGELKSDEERRVNSFLIEASQTYTHKPRKYISIYPTLNFIMHLIKNNDENLVFYHDDYITDVINDMINISDNDINSLIDGYNIYNRVIVELDTNYVSRLASLKNKNGNILFHLKRDILVAIEDIKNDYPVLAEKIVKNLVANTYTTKSLLIDNNCPFTVGNHLQKNKGLRKKTEFNIKFKILLDLTLIWYINYKIVQQNVCDFDIYENIDKVLTILDRVKRYDKVFYFKTLMSGDLKLKDNTLIDYLIQRITLSMFDNNAYEVPGLKYKPLFFPVDDNKKEMVQSDGGVKNTNNLISESKLIGFDIDCFDTINFIGECMLLDKTVLIQESIFSKFKKRDSKKIIKFAREVDQIAVEFEFMYDQYSKSDAMNRAYDCLDRIDKAMSKADTNELHNTLNDIRSNLLDLIKKNRKRNIKKQRTTINIEYPEGYGMNA